MKICAKFLKLLISEKSAQTAIVNQEQSRFLISYLTEKRFLTARTPRLPLLFLKYPTFLRIFPAFFPTFQSGIERYYV
jgi:hypothetical protein